MSNEEKILHILSQIQDEQKITNSRLDSLEQGQAGMRGDITDMRGDITDMRGDITDMRGDITGLKQGQAAIEKRVTKTEIMIENTIIPAIQVLKENQITIQNQIKKLSVIDSMQDDIATLKSAVKYLSQELDNVKKAM